MTVQPSYLWNNWYLFWPAYFSGMHQILQFRWAISFISSFYLYINLSSGSLFPNISLSLCSNSLNSHFKLPLAFHIEIQLMNLISCSSLTLMSQLGYFIYYGSLGLAIYFSYLLSARSIDYNLVISLNLDH